MALDTVVKEGFGIRLKGRGDYRLNSQDLPEMEYFVKEVASSFHNIGDAGVENSSYKEENGVGYFDIQFGPSASFRDVVDVSRALSLAGDLNCTSEVYSVQNAN